MCNIVQAGVSLVEDSALTPNVYMAKVISKTPIIEKVSQMTTKNYCEKYYKTTHYTGQGTDSIPLGVTYPVTTNPVCNIVTSIDNAEVIKGYNITYEYNGTIKFGKVNYDPGEFVPVHAGL